MRDLFALPRGFFFSINGRPPPEIIGSCCSNMPFPLAAAEYQLVAQCGINSNCAGQDAKLGLGVLPLLEARDP